MYVNPGKGSLTKALVSAEENGITNILLRNGLHDEGGKLFGIGFAVNITGESREGCIIQGSLFIEDKTTSWQSRSEDSPETPVEVSVVRISNLTINNSICDGIHSTKGIEMHLNNITIQNSRENGVVVNGGTNYMTNCEITNSRGNGVRVNWNGKIKIDGEQTSIHHNIYGNRTRNQYGLHTTFKDASILIVSPLTIGISRDNYQNQNYKCWKGTINIVDTYENVIQKFTSERFN